MVEGIVTEAVADSDYFITRAAALPLFEALGIPPIAATLASVLLATVPYEFIKISAKQKRGRDEENRLMNALLEEERERRTMEGKKRMGLFGPLLSNVDKGSSTGDDIGQSLNSKENKGRKLTVLSSLPLASSERSKSLTTTMPTTTATINVDTETSPKKVVPGTANAVDFVELFSDITKWLEYDVLSNDFSRKLTWNNMPINSGLESAIFGFLAALSSQLYADLIYRNSEYGLESNREESRNRSLEGWASLYSTKCLSAAALFGVYETVRIPVSTFISNLLTGGVDSCLGSKDFDLCLETYMIDNPADPTREAQIRSVIVAAINLIDRINLDLNNGNVDVTEFGRSLAVQLYSLVAQ